MSKNTIAEITTSENRISDRKKLRRLCLAIGIEFLLIFAVVWFFDPFYQYHGPFGNRQEVLYDRDNQMAGSVRNLTYDSVLIGSSVVENSNTDVLNEAFGCDTLKIIRGSGSVADLLYYFDMACEKQELKNVFWGLDLMAINSDVETTLYNDDIPRYLHTESILDDYTYVYNKDILMETIPMTLAYEFTGRNVGGNAYDWSEDKNFCAEMAMQAYSKPDVVLETIDFTDQYDEVSQNLAAVAARIERYPDITYRFFFVPYSMNWWDCAYVNGQLEQWFYILEQTLPVLTSYENVEVYYFQNEQDIVCNLDNYMDLVHYSPEINQYMMEQICKGEGRVTADTWEETVADMRDLVKRINEELIYQYYPR